MKKLVGILVAGFFSMAGVAGAQVVVEPVKPGEKEKVATPDPTEKSDEPDYRLRAHWMHIVLITSKEGKTEVSMLVERVCDFKSGRVKFLFPNVYPLRKNSEGDYDTPWSNRTAIRIDAFGKPVLRQDFEIVKRDFNGKEFEVKTIVASTDFVSHPLSPKEKTKTRVWILSRANAGCTLPKRHSTYAKAEWWKLVKDAEKTWIADESGKEPVAKEVDLADTSALEEVLKSGGSELDRKWADIPFGDGEEKKSDTKEPEKKAEKKD